MAGFIHKKNRFTSFQIIIGGFIAVILIGALLLMLPVSSKAGIITPFNEALFTSTSAVCVTGLVVQDTATYWSWFGQGIILVLIQIGGLGVITIAVSFALLSGRKISLMQRSVMQEAISAPKVGGIVRLTGFVLKGTFLVEFTASIIMMPVFAKDFGAKGLAYLCINEDGSYKSSFAKFMTEEELKNLVEAMAGEPGDLLLFAADKNKVVWDVLGNLRLELAKQMDLLDKNEFKFLWVTEFPLLEFNEELGRFQAMHHPFTMPMEEDIPYLESDPGRVRAQAYDIVLNGTEIGGGSIRIHQNDIQEKMFEALNFSKEDAYEQFGFLLDAFKYGVPPHAGLAYGLDRLVMLMAKEDSIREVIAFPKVKDASCLMTNAPSPVDAKQLDELGIMVEEKEEQAE